MPRFRLPFVLAAVSVAGLAATPALADAIDGNWCALDGRHFEIIGPTITTSAGLTTTGDYSRHAFSYKVPDGLPGAGASIAMALINDDALRLKTDRPPGADEEIWKRCEFTS